MARGNPRQIAAQAARKHGLPVNVFLRQMGKEAGFKDLTSPAGALGYAQFMPGTARAHGVNPHDPVSAYNGAAALMAHYYHQYGSMEKALAAYNAGPGAVAKYGGVPPYAETKRYVRDIMGGLGSPSLPGPPTLRSTPLGGGGGGDRLARLQASLQPSPEMTQILSQSGGTLGKVAAELAEHPIELPQAPHQTTAGALSGVQMPAGNTLQYAKLAPGADRAGVRTSRRTRAFVGKIGELAGHPLTIGTGTNHSHLTVNNNVSDHWSGHAADIPATGNELIRLGRLALIAAGMPRQQAMKQRGGLYNVGGHQVIFNTHEGGDHTNHLHVSVHH